MSRNVELAGPVPQDSTTPGWGRLSGARARWVVLLAVALVVAPSLAMVAQLFSSESSDGLTRIDRPVLDQAIALRSPGLDQAVLVYSYLGGPLVAILATAAAVVGLSVRWRSRTPFLLMLVAGAGSLAMSMTTKAYADRERPAQEFIVGSQEPSWSFPSGHALNAMIIAGVLAYLFIIRTRSRPVAVLAVCLAVVHTVLMSLSRVYLGQHWLTDVVVAWFMAAVWLSAVLGVHQLFLRQAERRQRSSSA